MKSLEDKLKQFDPLHKDKEKLASVFEDLAKSFLYGGYVSVKDCKGERYRIYLRTVEFYCHYEGEDSELLKDPIVYHRNGKYLKSEKDGEIEEVPYFPLMAFHAHASGIDITFENQELKLRSSALIRAYEIYDVKREKFLIYDRGDKKFVECKDDKKRVNSQSTYLYYFLNGFIGDKVKWEDVPWSDTKAIKADKRKNVFKYNGEEKTSEKDDREWSYTRLEDLKREDLKQEDKKSEDLK